MITTSILEATVLSISTLDELYGEEFGAILLAEKNKYNHKPQQYYMAKVRFGDGQEGDFDIGTNRANIHGDPEEDESGGPLFFVDGKVRVNITDGPMGRTFGSLMPA